MKRPSFQFYPGDWQGNSNLRRCTHEEKGIWIDVMCLMHDAPEYGVLRWPLKEITQAVGCKPIDIKGLITKGVLKGADLNDTCDAFFYTPHHAGKAGEAVELIASQPGPVWYSSRMVADEHVRQKKGNKTLYQDSPHYSPKGGIGELSGCEPNPSPKGGIVDLPSSSSSSSSKELPNGNSKKPVEKFILPESIPPDLWEAFEEGRRKKRKALTDAARTLNANRLLGFARSGHDLRRVMEDAISHGWDSFYEPKAHQSSPKSFLTRAEPVKKNVRIL